MMFLDEREIARNASLAFDGDESSFGEVFRSQHESFKLAHEALSKWNSYERSYDNDIETIEKITGVKLDNPYRVGAYGTAEQMARGFTGSPADFFETKVRELADQHPDLKEHLRLDVPRQQKAIEIRNRALVEADDVWERYDGYGKYAAWLAAGFAAGATDPVNVASMALGPWRAVAPGVQPVIMNALKVAGINMAAETIAQPWKRAWAEEAGQPWGWRESLLDIGSAGLFGLGLDAGVRGAFRGGQRLLGREPIIDEATRGVVGWRWPDRPKGAAQPPPKDPLKAAAEQDGATSEPQGRPVEEPAAAAPEAPATDVLPDPTQDPAVRGAVTELERYMLFGRPPEVDDGEHLARLASAIERADNPELPPPGNAIRGGADAMAQDAEALDAIETTIREGFRRLKEDIAEDQRAQIRHALGKLGIDEAMSLEEALAHVRRSFVERSAELDLGPGGRAGRLSEGIRPGSEAQQTALPPTGSVGTTVQIEGRPVQFVRLADGAVPIDDDALALRTGDGAGVAVAFESADGRVTTQRIGGRRETGEAPGAWLFREADGWTIEDARAYAARENLRQMSGSAMDMAMLLRWRNDLATRDLPLTQYKFKQAQGLAALSDDAFDLVLDGVLPPQYAALVGDLVEDASRHADFIRQMAEADLRSQQQAKIFLGQLMIEPTAADVQMRVLGVGEAARELIAERSDVLARSLRLLDNDKRLFNVLNREAAKIEAAGNILDRDENAARAQLHKNLVNVIRALAEVQGPVNDLLQEAAAHVNRGVKPKIAAEAFVSRVVDLYDREGLNGLLRSRAAAVTLPKGKMDDPSGPELEAQVRGLEQARVDAFDPYQFSLVRAMTEGGEQGLRARLARMTPDEIEDMARAQNIPLGEGEDIVTRLARGIEERIAQGRGPEEPPVRFATREDDDGIPDVGRRDRPEAAEGDRGVPPPAGDLTGRPRAEPGRVDAPRLAGDPDTSGQQISFRLGGRHGRRVGLTTPDGRPQLFYVLFGEKAEIPSARLTGRRAVDFLRELRQKIAWVRVDQTPQGRWYIGDVRVHKRHRRRGLASQLYDGIEADLGIRLEPSFVLKPDGLAFWQRRNPDAVRYYRPYGDGYVSPQVLIARYAYLESAVERATTQAEMNAILAEWDQVKRGLASLPPEAVTEDKIRFAIRAFHGSPHDFERFDMSKIGTGEGAQAYGRGLYFAEAEDVAKQYRDQLGWAQNAMRIGDRGYTFRDAEKLAADYDIPVSTAYEVLAPFGPGRGDESPIEFLQARLDNPLGDPARKSATKAALEFHKKHAPETGGRLYEVRINAEPEDFLDWDKPLSQQSEFVQRTLGVTPEVKQALADHLNSMRPKSAYDPDLWAKMRLLDDNPRGSTIAGNDPDSARRLREAGIPGIRYLDQGSRAAGEGSYNYVVFDDSLIEIVAKDGKPVTPEQRADILRQTQEEAVTGDKLRFARTEVTQVTPELAEDVSVGRSMRRALDELGFYSQALEAARSLKQKKGTPEQMRAQLKAAGVKDAELAATGLDALLEGKKSVTRDEIVTRLEENRVQLREVVRRSSADRDELSFQLFDRPWDRLTPDQRDMVSATFAQTKWQQYSLDPSNPTYRETVLHLPGGMETIEAQKQQLRELGAEGRISEAEFNARMDDLQRRELEVPETQFQSGHFPEPNIVGHLMTSMVRDADGKPVYLIDQIQSDWGQRLRDKGVRDEAKIADLRRQVDDLVQRQRDLGKEARGIAERYGHETRQVDTPDDHDRLISEMIDGEMRVPDGPDRERVFELQTEFRRVRHDKELRSAELRTEEAQTPGHPLVATTDQWVNTTLRRAIRQAVEADADAIAIPHGDTVLSYNPGDEAGMRGFYGSRTQEGIVPKNLRKLLERIDKQSPKPQRVETLETPQGPQGWNAAERYPFDKSQTGFTIFPLTDKVKQSVISEGQPMFARPRAAADQQAAPDFLETLPKRYNLTPAASEAMPEIRTEIDKIFARLPEGIRSRVVGNIVYNGQQMAGVWDPYERLVGVVLSSKSPRYARHELWHVLEDLGYLTEAEVAVVRARAERDRLRDFYRIDERYLRQFSEQYRNDPLGAERALWSETFAEMLADFEQGRSFGPVVDRILRSVSRFIERIRNMLAGRGFQSVEDIFERILTTDEIRTRITPHSIWVKAQRENAQRIGLEQIEAHLERAFSGPKFARVDDNLLAREAANLADSVSRFVEELKAGGRTFGEISQALKDRYGFEVPAAQLAAGEVWWRVPDVPETRGLGVEPELEQKFRVTGQVPGSIERVSDSSDITARPPQPQRLSGRETPREFPRVVTRLNDEQKARVIDLWRANTSNARISEILTQEGGKYVPITSVISVVEQHIEAHPSRRALPLTETERAATSPEFAGMTARQIAEALTERTGRKVTPNAVYRARQRATQKGETVPELAGTRAPGSRIDPEWLHAGKFRWTDETIATLKRDDIARLSAADAAKALNDLFSPDAPIVTANAVRLQRSKLGISKGKKAVRGEPRLMLRRGRWVIYDNNREIALKLPESAREEAEQRLAAYKAEKAKPDTLSDDPDVPGSMADAERVEAMATLAEACKR